MKIASAVAVLLALSLSASAWAQPKPPALTLVAAENFYGDVASQVAGPDVTVSSILSNPDQDPHLFEASPSVARALSSARIVIYNGAGYDQWMSKLIGATEARNRTVLVASELGDWNAGGNPHLWYDPAVMPAVAKALAAALTATNPAHKDAYAARLNSVLKSLEPLDAKVAAMRKQFAGTPVTATEPVFGLMARAIGLDMRNERFQTSVMNGTEPRVSDVAAFETDLKQKRVRALIYNAQATGPAAKRMLALAKRGGVPVVGVSETEPAGQDYQTWMLKQLAALDAALSAKP